MYISRVLAWISVVLFLLTVLKYFARVSKIRPLNRFFRKIHIPVGVLLLITSFIHGIIAGNPYNAGIKDMTFFSVFFTFNYGTGAFVGMVLLAVVYIFRKKLRRKWMGLHRLFTVIALVLVVMHMVEFDAFSQLGFGTEDSEPTVAESSVVDQSVQPTVRYQPSETQQEQTQQEQTQPEQTQPPVTFSGAVVADGTYEGNAQGYHGDIYVTVTVQNSQVTDITVTDNNDTARFFDQALQIIDRIISGQSLEVDSVTGATYSSEGIRNAVYDALSQAVVSGELNIITVTPSGHRH